MKENKIKRFFIKIRINIYNLLKKTKFFRLLFRTKSKTINGKPYIIHHCWCCGHKIKVCTKGMQFGDRYGYRCDICESLADCRYI